MTQRLSKLYRWAATTLVVASGSIFVVDGQQMPAEYDQAMKTAGTPPLLLKLFLYQQIFVQNLLSCRFPLICCVAIRPWLSFPWHF